MLICEAGPASVKGSPKRLRPSSDSSLRLAGIDVGQAERHVRSEGLDPGAASKAIELVRARGCASQICVIRHGDVVLKRSFECDERDLFWIFSASKPYAAVLILMLADRGLLGLDDPVCAHWPEFAAYGKGAITIRQVLQHRSGLADRDPINAVLSFTNWRRSIRRVVRAQPVLPAGQAPAYLPLTYGFILGELVQRITQRPVGEVLATDLLRPLGLRDTYLGLPVSEWERRVPIIGSGFRGRLTSALANRKFVRRAVIPAAGISTTAADLAQFYLMLMRSGRHGDQQLLSPAILREARKPSSDGEMDRSARLPLRWSNGFQLGGPRTGASSASPFGWLSSPHSFGHNGSNCCIGWADPDRNLVFAYLTNRLDGRAEGSAHLAAVADAIVTGCR
ncbi:MAG: beta-lactamase family protein [Alphaproteobacteria bacterium]|nr:beta-lactamase family protein [Alphaproteobacteria bacterium]MBV8409328.1 beta-lactamase family protein [Alphaproteobacteria bacterium]